MVDGNCSRITSDTLHAEGVARASGGRASATDSSSSSRSSESSAPSRPPAVYIDHSVTVSGGVNYQPVTDSGIGNAAVLAQGVVSATDVWGVVPSGTRVCFIERSGSAVMFLNAAYSPRLLSQLPHFVDGGNICVDLPGAGTVVLVGGAAPADPPAPAPDFSQPLCQIKLSETLYLRDAPGGRSFALVWQYSEVPVYVIDGDWYLVEFRGRSGYIWRHYRNVLWGECS
ncbi:MAG: hypothetical protein OXI62_06350 [Chloroflexota bacterium]|nr:hypothetical protein [Chloroflexota bacterium]MXV92893.1 hypothetical protein [Chloroflexota bacterium]MXX83980.1 hypothetical protein [Chloroflexota bacterium]MYC56009.1 hypothetical protein [Chloroflexota bacterium]MYD38661.1 hypothetical protein [Chloroflexota bacterium]